MTLNINFFQYLFFGEIGNDTMFNIAMLYKETVIILLLIMYIVIAIILYIIENFSHEKNKFPIYFNKETESTLDIIFVLFPTVIIGYLIVPAVGYVYNTEYNMAQLETLFDVTIIGHQWYWSYEYSINLCNDNNLYLFGERFIHEKLAFDSLIDMGAEDARLLAVDKRLVLPSNSYINLCITSEDVIHSWALPHLGIKVDAIPGRLAEYVFHTNFNGIFYGQCSELCGVNHGFMPICVETVPYLTFLDFLLISLNFNPSKLLLDNISLYIESDSNDWFVVDMNNEVSSNNINNVDSVINENINFSNDIDNTNDAVSYLTENNDVESNNVISTTSEDEYEIVCEGDVCERRKKN